MIPEEDFLAQLRERNPVESKVMVRPRRRKRLAGCRGRPGPWPRVRHTGPDAAVAMGECGRGQGTGAGAATVAVPSRGRRAGHPTDHRPAWAARATPRTALHGGRGIGGSGCRRGGDYGSGAATDLARVTTPTRGSPHGPRPGIERPGRGRPPGGATCASLRGPFPAGARRPRLSSSPVPARRSGNPPAAPHRAGAGRRSPTACG